MSEIIQLSIPRTGSTLLFQVLSDLFPGTTIVKAHDWHPSYDGKKIVSSYRDPRATAVSYWRTNKDIKTPQKKMSRGDIKTYYKSVNSMATYFLSLRKNQNMLFLKYEDFYKDFDFLFEKLESYFGCTFDEDLKSKISEQRSISSNKVLSEKLQTFKSFDKKNLLHGNHIYKNGSSDSWRDFIKPNDVNFFEEVFRPVMIKLGYK